jgi:hypothetical protein
MPAFRHALRVGVVAGALDAADRAGRQRRDAGGDALEWRPYFVDVFARIGIAVLSIVAARRVGRLIARRMMMPELPGPVPAMVPAE